MRAAKASKAANAIGHSATKMITPFIIDERKGKFNDPREVCRRGDRG
jgi:hypothetical protein